MKSKPTFSMSAVKLALDKDWILKTLDSVRVELNVVNYTLSYGKTFGWQKEGAEMKKRKKGQKWKIQKNGKKEDMEVVWEFKYRRLP